MSCFMVNLLEMIQLSSWNKLKVAQGYTFHFAVMSMFLRCVRVRAEPWKHFWKAVVMKRTLMELGAWFVLFIYFVYFEEKITYLNDSYQSVSINVFLFGKSNWKVEESWPLWY